MTPKRKVQPPTILIQLDLDGLWAVRAAYGLGETQESFERDAVYEEALPRFLDLFEQRGVRATLFATGRDAAHPAKRNLLARAAAAGHEIANHSLSHRIGLGGLAPDEIQRDLEAASQALAEAAGGRPVGFRAPGYDASPPVLRAVADAGYLYDASLLPTRVGALMRLAATRLRAPKDADLVKPGPSRRQYGGAGPVWRAPRGPYRCRIERPWERAKPGEATVIEAPVAVSRHLGLPVHASVGMALGRRWTHRALRGLLRPGETIAYVFHGVDLTGPESLRAAVGRRGLLARRLFGLALAHKERFVAATLDLLLAQGRALRTRDGVEKALEEEG